MRVISEQEPRALRDTPSGMARVDTDLQSIVLKALAKEPERRYSSAAALAKDLERYRNSQPVLARTPSTTYQLRKLVARHKPLVAALAVALVAIVAAAVVSTVMFVRARNQAAKSQQVAAFLSGMLEGAGPAVARGRDTALMSFRVNSSLQHPNPVAKTAAGLPEATSSCPCTASRNSKRCTRVPDPWPRSSDG